MSMPRVNDEGRPIRVTVLKADGTPEDLSSFTTKTLKLKRPSDGVVLEKDAVFSTDGTDGRLEYVPVAGDLSVEGPWIGQLFLAKAGPVRFHTEQWPIQVGANL